MPRENMYILPYRTVNTSQRRLDSAAAEARAGPMQVRVNHRSFARSLGSRHKYEHDAEGDQQRSQPAFRRYRLVQQIATGDDDAAIRERIERKGLVERNARER